MEKIHKNIILSIQDPNGSQDEKSFVFGTPKSLEKYSQKYGKNNHHALLLPCSIPNYNYSRHSNIEFKNESGKDRVQITLFVTGTVFLNSILDEYKYETIKITEENTEIPVTEEPKTFYIKMPIEMMNRGYMNFIIKTRLVSETEIIKEQVEAISKHNEKLQTVLSVLFAFLICVFTVFATIMMSGKENSIIKDNALSQELNQLKIKINNFDKNHFVKSSELIKLEEKNTYLHQQIESMKQLSRAIDLENFTKNFNEIKKEIEVLKNEIKSLQPKTAYEGTKELLTKMHFLWQEILLWGYKNSQLAFAIFVTLAIIATQISIICRLSSNLQSLRLTNLGKQD